METTITDEGFEKVLLTGIREHIKVILDSEISKARKSLEQEIKKEVDKIALNVLSNYSVSRMGQDLHIVVSKKFTE